jgi:hypothetical protein
MAVLRLALCKACRTTKPVTQMIHASGHRLFCSKGCAAKAEWLFTSVPTPRKAP